MVSRVVVFYEWCYQICIIFTHIYLANVSITITTTLSMNKPCKKGARYNAQISKTRATQSDAVECHNQDSFLEGLPTLQGTQSAYSNPCQHGNLHSKHTHTHTCIYVCVYIYVYMYIHTHTQTQICVCVCVCLRVCLCVFTRAYACECCRTCGCVYARVYLRTRVSVFMFQYFLN